MPTTAVMPLMSIIISVDNLLWISNRPRLSCVIKYFICKIHQASSVGWNGDKEETQPQNGQYKHANTHLRKHYRAPLPFYIYTWIALLFNQKLIYICILACFPSLLYPNHNPAHRVTLKANQMLKGFSLWPEEDRLVCGDHWLCSGAAQ